MPWPHLEQGDVQDVLYSWGKIAVLVARTSYDWTTNVVGILICAEVCVCMGEIVCACGCCSSRLYLTWPRWAPGPTTMTTKELYVKVRNQFSFSKPSPGTLRSSSTMATGLVTPWQTCLLTFAITSSWNLFKPGVKGLFHYRAVYEMQFYFTFVYRTSFEYRGPSKKCREFIVSSSNCKMNFDRRLFSEHLHDC